MHALVVGSTLQTESDLLLNMKLAKKNSKLPKSSKKDTTVNNMKRQSGCWMDNGNDSPPTRQFHDHRIGHVSVKKYHALTI